MECFGLLLVVRFLLPRGRRVAVRYISSVCCTNINSYHTRQQCRKYKERADIITNIRTILIFPDIAVVVLVQRIVVAVTRKKEAKLSCEVVYLSYQAVNAGFSERGVSSRRVLQLLAYCTTLPRKKNRGSLEKKYKRQQ